jgi:hypothetical protein
MVAPLANTECRKTGCSAPATDYLELHHRSSGQTLRIPLCEAHLREADEKIAVGEAPAFSLD